MLSIGMFELVVVALVALVFVGPERLPMVMREMGRMYGRLRRAADELRRAFVLEADRQDAEDRYDKLKERRKKAAETRRKAQEDAGEGTVTQDESLPGLDDEPAPSGEEEDREEAEEVAEEVTEPEVAAGGE